MRTTIRIDDELLNQAKKLALESQISLTALIETALKEKLARRQTNRVKQAIQLVTYKGRGTKPGVDLDDTSALLELMEGG